MPKPAHVNLTLPPDLWKELRDHVEEKKKDNPGASASDIIRTLIRNYLKKMKSKRKK